MKKVNVIFILMIMGIAKTSYGFEVDGFKDGMRKEIVVEKLKAWHFDKIVEIEGENTLSAYDLENGSTFSRYYSFNFQGETLAALQKGYKPSMANYIILFKELNSEFGEKSYCNADIKLISNGENKSITCAWFSRKEKISVSYNVYDANDQLSVYYDAFNKYPIKKK